MASQRINELNTLSSLDDADLILSFDDSASETKAITRADLKADIRATGGDGVDLTGDVLSVDIVPATDYSSLTAVGVSSEFVGPYTRLGEMSIDASDNWVANGRYFFVHSTDVTRAAVYDEGSSQWRVILDSDGDFSTLPTAAAAVPSINFSFSMGADEVTYENSIAQPDGDSSFWSYAPGGGLEFVSGQLQVKEGDLRITESQISDFGTYATSSSVTASLALKADAADVSNVDNTADADKPVSTAAQAALDLKADLASPALTGTPTAPTPAAADDSTAIATTEYVQTELADFALEADVLLLDGTQAMTSDLDLGTNRISNVVDPSAAQDAATKAYVDSATSGQGVFWTPVQVESDVDLTLSGEQTIDGVLTSSSRILVNGQTDASENGIYVTDAGAWSRSIDANDSTEYKTNKTVFVEEGTNHSGNIYAYTGSDDPTLDTDSLTFVLKSSAAQIAAGSITTAKLADDAVTSAKINAGAVDADALATNINVNEFVATTTPETEPTTYYFLVVDQSDGSIKVVDKSFLEA